MLLILRVLLLLQTLSTPIYSFIQIHPLKIDKSRKFVFLNLEETNVGVSDVFNHLPSNAPSSLHFLPVFNQNPQFTYKTNSTKNNNDNQQLEEAVDNEILYEHLSFIRRRYHSQLHQHRPLSIKKMSPENLQAREKKMIIIYLLARFLSPAVLGASSAFPLALALGSGILLLKTTTTKPRSK